MNTTVRIQLSVMMFLQFFVWGAWYVTAPNYLGTIGFGATDFGWTYSVGPIAGMISPFFVGMIADRFFPAQNVLAIMHIAGGIIMGVAASLMTAAEPSPTLINWVLFGYMLTYYPTLALTNTLAMKNMANPDKEFPLIRVFGTIGWIAAGLTLTGIGWDTSIKMFHMTAASGLALGICSFFLPNTPPEKGDITVRQILGLDALVLLKNRSYLVFMVSSFLICIPLAFYYQIASRVVEMGGLPIGRTMSYGQMSEIFFMLIMPFF
ncbi:MAG TPA: MFS transporter, partial [Verrucomicrobia bacterium]|nr:MFS transporter [Verrucomicrobiota bacterium]